MDEQQANATHIAVPIQLFQAVTKILGTLPYEQVSGFMQGLTNCHALHMKQNVKPGDDVLLPLNKKAAGG